MSHRHVSTTLKRTEVRYNRISPDYVSNMLRDAQPFGCETFLVENAWVSHSDPAHDVKMYEPGLLSVIDCNKPALCRRSPSIVISAISTITALSRCHERSTWHGSIPCGPSDLDEAHK
jgi:hypothetical protein